MLPSPQKIFMMLCHQLIFSVFSFFVVIVFIFFLNYNNRINVGSFPRLNEKETRKSVNKHFKMRQLHSN